MPAAIDRVAEAILAVLMVAMCVLVFVGVVFRYVLEAPITWTEEVAELCLVWATFIGAYLAYRRGQHIAVTAIAQRLAPARRQALGVAVHALLAVFMAMLVVQGARYAAAFLTSYSPIIEFPMGLIYAALPVSAALFLAAIVADLVAMLRGRGEGAA